MTNQIPQTEMRCKNWKRVTGGNIGRLTAEEARAVIDTYHNETRAAGQTIHHESIRALTGGLNSQSINFYVLAKLNHKARRRPT